MADQTTKSVIHELVNFLLLLAHFAPELLQLSLQSQALIKQILQGKSAFLLQVAHLLLTCISLQVACLACRWPLQLRLICALTVVHVASALRSLSWWTKVAAISDPLQLVKRLDQDCKNV